MRDFRIFEYTGGKGILNRLKPGYKLGGMIIICIFTAASPPLLLIIPAAITAILLINAGRTLVGQFRGMWKLFLFFTLSGLIRGYTASSAADGFLFTSRLILMSAAGILFYSSTRFSALRLSLNRLFSHLPFINGRHVSELFVMALAFLPVIFKTINEQQQARYSRSFIPRRNIIRAIKLTSIPLMIEMFIKTEEMADAWYSRGYDSSVE